MPRCRDDPAVRLSQMGSPGRAGTRRWVAIAMLAVGLVVVTALVSRELFAVRAILGLEDDGACTPSLVSTRLPANTASGAGEWELTQAYPNRRDELRAAAVGGRIYVGTGLTVREGHFWGAEELYEFDPGRGTYQSVDPVPVAVDHAAFVGYEGALYIFGGYVGDEPSAAAWRFSPQTGRWEELAPMRVPRGSAAAAAVGDRIYVVGGTQAVRTTEGAMSTVEIYDVDAGTWTAGPDMPTPRHHHDAAAIDGRLVVVGGRGNDDLSMDTVEQFDPLRDRWTSLPSLPLGAGGLAVTATPDVVLAIGGGDDEEQWVTPAAWALAPGDSKWRRLADLNVSRHGHAAAAVDSGVFVFGGAPCPGYGRTESVEFLPQAWVDSVR